jgi:hypothetical protein
MSDPKIYVFDIESYDLRANRGWLVCLGYKEVGKKKIHMIAPDTTKTRKAKMYHLWGEEYVGDQMTAYRPFNDRKLLQQTLDSISDASAYVGHFHSRHDVPFINTRLVGHKMGTLPPAMDIDLWRVARYQMNMTRNGLQQVSDFLRSTNKYHVSMDEWARACIHGDAQCMEKIIRHCKDDVKMTEENYLKLRGLSKYYINHALGKDDGTCPRCGVKGRLTKSGTRRTSVSVYKRYLCKACGGWSHGSPTAQRGVLR